MISISVLTPSYNYRQFLPTAINSVLGSGDSIEHVVMDADSTDGTQDVLSASPQSVVWRSESDRGQSDALNKALRLSSGNVIGWLNADDFYLPGTIDLVRTKFQEDPDLDVLYGDTVLVDGEGRILRLLNAYHAPSKVLAWRGPVFLSTATFYRRRVLGADPFDVRMRMLMDWDLFLKLLKDETLKFKYLPIPLAAFRVHELQVTHNQAGHRSSEHSLLRQKHHINEQLVPLTRPLGVGLHRFNKLIRGSWLREVLARQLRGHSLLNPDGDVDPQTADMLLRVVRRPLFSRVSPISK